MSNPCPTLEFPLLAPKLDPATKLDGQRFRLSPKAGRDLLQTPHSRNRLEVEPGSRRHLYPHKEEAPTAPSHIGISAAIGLSAKQTPQGVIIRRNILLLPSAADRIFLSSLANRFHAKSTAGVWYLLKDHLLSTLDR